MQTNPLPAHTRSSHLQVRAQTQPHFHEDFLGPLFGRQAEGFPLFGCAAAGSRRIQYK